MDGETQDAALDRPLQAGPLKKNGLNVDDPESGRPLIDGPVQCVNLKPSGGLRVQFTAGDSISSSSDESSSVCTAAPRPPDGGWGWVVVFAAFMINLIADGITFSFGVFYMHFLDYFEEGKAKTAWIGGIFMAMPLLSGPVASVLTDRYGCRRVTVLGALLAALGFVASAFVSDMETLFLTFGVFAGFGLSLCYVAAVVVVAYYFEKKRSLATGISVCGSGIGTFLFAPLVRLLLEEYGWRGATLLLAGAFLHMMAFGLLMRDLPWTENMIAAKSADRRRRRKREHDSCSDSRSSAAGGDEAMAVVASVPQFSSLVDLPTYMHGVPHEMHHSLSASDSGRLHEPPPPQPASDARLPHHAQPAAPPAFLRDLRVHRRSLTYRGAMLNISRYRLRASSCPNIYRNSMTTIAEEKLGWSSGLWELWEIILDSLDFSHLADPTFLLFALSNFLLYAWYDVPYVYIADSAQEMGFSEQRASMLISVIGIVNMLGEIVLGWAGDWENASAGVIYALSMILCGGVTALMPALSSYSALASASGAFGFFIAANYSLTSIILVELIGLERFTNAYGLLLLIQGVANLVGPPLAGWVYDVTSSYDLSFYLAGVFIACSGLLMLVLPTLRLARRWRKPRPLDGAVQAAG